MAAILSIFLSFSLGTFTDVHPVGTTIDVEGAVEQEMKCCGYVNKRCIYSSKSVLSVIFVDVFYDVVICTSCGGHVPDIPARVFYDTSKSTVRMIVGSTIYFPMTGPTVTNQTRSCTFSYNKSANPNPAKFAADEYLDSPFSFGNGTVVSLVHTEFPGNRFNMSGGPGEPYCVGPGYPRCWTVSIGMVVSHDWGQTFHYPEGKRQKD